MSFEKRIIELIHAGFAGLWIHSQEADTFEAEQEIIAVAIKYKWHAITWDAARGLRQLDGTELLPPGPGSEDKAITAWQNIEDKGATQIKFLHNFHRFIQNNPRTIQLLINSIVQGKAENRITIVISSVLQIPIELEKLFTVVDHSLPTVQALEGIADSLKKQNDQTVTPDDRPAILASLGLSRYEAECAYSLSLTKNGQLDTSDIFDLKAQILQKSGLLTLYRGQERFKDLGGMQNLKEFTLRALKNQKPNRPQPRGILLFGVPGTGKSAFAKALGNEVGRPTALLDIGSMYGKYVGESEGKIRNALKAADAMAPCILFVDELEKGFSGAGSTGDSGVGSRITGTMLTWMNDHESDVFLIGTCNDISALPPEFSRAERFDGVFFLDLLTEEERNIVWAMYLAKYHGPKVKRKPNSINDNGWTGAEIKACCRLSSMLDIPLEESAKNIVPIAISSADKINVLRDWAHKKCLSSNEPGVYERDRHPTPSAAPRRKLVMSK